MLELVYVCMYTQGREPGNGDMYIYFIDTNVTLAVTFNCVNHKLKHFDLLIINISRSLSWQVSPSPKQQYSEWKSLPFPTAILHNNMLRHC